MEDGAIPPSSPPHLGSISPQSPPFFEPQHGAFTSKSSSPPPLFSSDDSRESVDVTNYESPRIYKNKRKGAWWDNHESAHNSPEVKKTKFCRNLDRNFDSGVYMLSDATDSSDDLLPQHKSPFPDGNAHTTDDHAVDVGSSDAHGMELDVSSCPAVRAVPAVPKVITSAAERAFNQQIDEGLDKDQETYDFEGQDLQDSDITRIGELKNVIKDPLIYDSERPTEGQFRSLEPDIRIILNKNRLHRLVPSLFDITYLTSLSLCDNHIEELPNEIRQLSRLESFYLARNNLKYLPFDILHLIRPYGKLARLTTMSSKYLEPMTSERFQSGARLDGSYPAPLDSFEPFDRHHHYTHSQLSKLYKFLATCEDRDSTVWYIRYLETRANCLGGEHGTHIAEVGVGFYPHHPSLYMCREDPHFSGPSYIARTLVSYYDQTGTLLHGSPALPCSNNENYPIIIETNRGTYGVPSSPWFAPPSSSKVSSLITTALTRSLRLDSVADLRKMISDDGQFEIPRVAEKILARADENAAGGYSVFRECHMCHKRYIVARAEWIEFWKTDLSAGFLPLKVSVCSWGCVPSQMMHRPEKQLSW